jgi:Flp pilus assembly pilin Flp
LENGHEKIVKQMAVGSEQRALLLSIGANAQAFFEKAPISRIALSIPPALTSTRWWVIMFLSISFFSSYAGNNPRGRKRVAAFIRRIWCEDAGQDIAEYAVMLAVILVLVVGTIRLIGSNANNAFSAVASSIQ